MPVINSTSFLLFRDQTAVGHSTDTQVTLNLDLPETTTKDSGGWKEFIACARGGQISCNGLTAYDDSLNFEEFCDDVITRSIQTFYFKESSNPTFIIRAEGFIVDVSETAEFENATSFDLNIQLTGIITAGDERNWENIFEFWEDIATQWQNV
jgi:predicted secreted protein